jgi:hypothetical protein
MLPGGEGVRRRVRAPLAICLPACQRLGRDPDRAGELPLLCGVIFTSFPFVYSPLACLPTPRTPPHPMLDSRALQGGGGADMGGGSVPVAPKKKSQVMPSPLCVLCGVPSRHFPRCTETLPSFRHGPSPSRAQEPDTDWKLIFWVIIIPFIALIVVRTPPIRARMLSKARACATNCAMSRARATHGHEPTHRSTQSVCGSSVNQSRRLRARASAKSRTSSSPRRRQVKQ